MPTTDRTGRSDARSTRVVRLGDPQSEDLSATTTAAQRVEMVALLSRRMWELTGRPLPAYPREETPTRIVRPR